MATKKKTAVNVELRKTIREELATLLAHWTPSNFYTEYEDLGVMVVKDENHKKIARIDIIELLREMTPELTL